MRRIVVFASVVVAIMGALVVGWVKPGTAAQEATPAMAIHPFVGTWVVDTISASENDSPEIAVVTAHGGVIGQGANRVAGGRWEAIDDRSVELTLVTVFEQDGVGG